MKSLIWKEWRENLKWIPLPAFLILSPMALMGPAPILDRGYLFFVSLFAALFGALLGASAGALLAGQTGALLGLLIGGALAVLGRALPAAATAGAVGALLGPIHLASEGGAVAGGLLGVLLAVCVVEVGRTRKRNPGAGANPPLLATCCLGKLARRRRCGRGNPPADEAEGQGRA